MPLTPALGRRGMEKDRSPELQGPASLVKVLNFWFCDRPYLKGIRQRVIEDNVWAPSAFVCVHNIDQTYQTHTFTHAHTLMHIHTHTHLYTHTFINTHLHIHTDSHTHIHTYTFTHIHRFTHIHTHNSHTHTRIYTYTQIHIHIHVHTHTFTHT